MLLPVMASLAGAGFGAGRPARAVTGRVCGPGAFPHSREALLRVTGQEQLNARPCHLKSVAQEAQIQNQETRCRAWS